MNCYFGNNNNNNNNSNNWKRVTKPSVLPARRNTAAPSEHDETSSSTDRRLLYTFCLANSEVTGRKLAKFLTDVESETNFVPVNTAFRHIVVMATGGRCSYGRRVVATSAGDEHDYDDY